MCGRLSLDPLQPHLTTAVCWYRWQILSCKLNAVFLVTNRVCLREGGTLTLRSREGLFVLTATFFWLLSCWLCSLTVHIPFVCSVLLLPAHAHSHQSQHAQQNKTTYITANYLTSNQLPVYVPLLPHCGVCGVCVWRCACVLRIYNKVCGGGVKLVALVSKLRLHGCFSVWACSDRVC